MAKLISLLLHILILLRIIHAHIYPLYMRTDCAHKNERSAYTMNPSTLPFLKVALDVGFHAIKVATVYMQAMFTYTLQAIVGFGETDMGMLQTGLTRQKRLNLFDVVLNQTQHLLVGPDVKMVARPVERTDFDRLAYAPETQALVYASLAQLIQMVARKAGVTLADQVIDLGLLVALPVQVLQGPEARSVVSTLENWLIGEHSFSVDGQPYHLRIHSLKAMAQPLGSFFEWGLTPDGQWQRSQSDLKSNIGVLDQGFNTLDLFTLSGGQIMRRYTGGETLGMRRAAHLMQDLFYQQTGRRVSLHEADGYLRQFSNGHGSELLVRGENVNIKPLARQALDVAFGEMRAYLSQVWEDGRQFDYILLTGGGALALGNRLRNVYPQAIELPEPVSANVRGLARFAQRKGILEATNQVA